MRAAHSLTTSRNAGVPTKGPPSKTLESSRAQHHRPKSTLSSSGTRRKLSPRRLAGMAAMQRANDSGHEPPISSSVSTSLTATGQNSRPASSSHCNRLPSRGSKRKTPSANSYALPYPQKFPPCSSSHCPASPEKTIHFPSMGTQPPSGTSPTSGASPDAITRSSSIGALLGGPGQYTHAASASSPSNKFPPSVRSFQPDQLGAENADGARIRSNNRIRSPRTPPHRLGIRASCRLRAMMG